MMNFKAAPLTREEEITLAETGLEANHVKIAEAQLPAIYAECRSIGGKDADEVLTDAWLAALSAARKWKPNGKARFWAYAQEWVRPAIRDSLRKQQGVVSAPKGRAKPETATIHADDDGAGAGYDVPDDPGRIWSEIVDDRDQQMLKMRLVERMSIDEIMAVYKIEARTVRKRLARLQKQKIPTTPPD